MTKQTTIVVIGALRVKLNYKCPTFTTQLADVDTDKICFYAKKGQVHNNKTYLPYLS